MSDILFARGHEIKNTSDQSKVRNVRRHYSIFSKILMIFKAKNQARKIIKGLNEAEKIHSGRTEGKSFDQFLKEI